MATHCECRYTHTPSAGAAGRRELRADKGAAAYSKKRKGGDRLQKVFLTEGRKVSTPHRASSCPARCSTCDPRNPLPAAATLTKMMTPSHVHTSKAAFFSFLLCFSIHLEDQRTRRSSARGGGVGKRSSFVKYFFLGFGWPPLDGASGSTGTAGGRPGGDLPKTIPGFFCFRN